MSDIQRCAGCGQTSGLAHSAWKNGQGWVMCCQCHVRSGEPPADWHASCGFIKMWLESPPPVFVARFSSVVFQKSERLQMNLK